MRYILLLTMTLTGCACPFLKKSTKAYPQNTANHLKNTLELTAKKTAPLARVDGIKVGGIPGTAQAITPDGKYASNKYWTMFAGFFPLENPKYVCLVVVNEANVKSEFNYGALVAAPIFSEISKKIY
jgi:cell division protein FtsI/penicillin-binding protein 2